MKEFVTVTKGYTYSELSEAAREKVKEWYLNRDWRADDFYEIVMCDLVELFPNSDLNVKFSLSYCQGDGLNIFGKLNLCDWLKKWKASEQEKKQIEIYLDYCQIDFIFEENYRYCFSCKFLNKNYVGEDIEEWIEELNENFVLSDSDKEIIERFYLDMLEYFENLDEQYKKDGYKYLYECDDDEVQECCESNDWYFTANGDFIG